ncbi:MAG TPA: hypothetical protein VFB44_08640 [Thermoleophilaceae bacterium]|nr:hypothetical protein [Thermoleophilaceae bacterium]
MFPTVGTTLAQAAAAAFVPGTYLVAERLKRPARRSGRDRVPSASGRVRSRA